MPGQGDSAGRRYAGHRREQTPRTLILGGRRIAIRDVLYQVLPLIGVPVALGSGAMAVILLKHLGILAVLLTPMYALLRRRSRR